MKNFKKNFNKSRFLFPIVFAAFFCVFFASLSLSGCGDFTRGESGRGDSDLIINLSTTLDSEGRAAGLPWPPDSTILRDINYDITLEGNAQIIPLSAKGGDTIRVTVTAGPWNISIRAFYPDRNSLYATGSNSVNVVKGSSNTVNIDMKRAVEEPVVTQCVHTPNLETGLCTICGALTYKLGDPGPGGGIIFYRSESGFTFYQGAADTTGVPAHYLEASLVNQAENVTWVSAGFTHSDNPTGSINMAIGTGMKNTALVLAADPTAPAAKACNDYFNNGKSDWFLPSGDELIELWKSREIVGIPSNGTYWSSSAVSATGVRHSDFSDGSFGNLAMTNLRNARAIRAF